MSSDPQQELDFDAWQEILCHHFFREENSGRPLVLFVDPALLSRVSGLDPAAAEESLTRAVLRRTPGFNFLPILLDARIWQRSGAVGCPPSLPLLALAVLAASHMARDGKIGAHNYYVRFRGLFRTGGRGELGNYGTALPPLWEQMSWWLDDKTKGRFGFSTIDEHPRLSLIGYALSQALFREADRQRLTHFLEWIDHEPGQSIEAEELLVYFRAWAAREGRVSRGVRQMLSDDHYSAQLGRILELAASSWDGTLRDEKGRRQSRLRLALELFPQASLRLVAESAPGLPDHTACQSKVSGSYELIRASDGWFDVSPDSVTADLLDSGLKLDAQDLSLEFDPSPIVVLRENTNLGAWVSVDSMTPSDSHWLLVREDFETDVSAYLQENASEEWRLARGARLGVPGWLLFRDVVVDEFPQARPGPPLDVLVPRVEGRVSLWGGLPLPRGERVFLTGGEPDVWVPTDLLQEDAAVSVDGRILGNLAEGKIQLRSLGLNPGVHEIVAGPSSSSFFSVESTGMVVSPEAGSITQSLWGRVTEPDPEGNRDTPVVIGARAQGYTGFLESPIILPYEARSYFVLGANAGEVEMPTSPEQPGWLKTFDLVPIGFEHSPAFRPAWSLIRSRKRVLRIVACYGIPPTGAALEVDPVLIEGWCRCFLDDRAEIPERFGKLWAEFVSVAEGIASDR